VVALICQLIGAVLFGMWLGRTIERHRSNTKVGTPSASHNSSSMPRECEHRWDGEGQCMRCGHLLGQPFRRGIR